MIDTIAVHWSELLLAEAAFMKALGLTPPSDDSRASVLSLLNDSYKRYGVSSGMHQTRQLVRAFETAAEEQARALGGKKL